MERKQRNKVNNAALQRAALSLEMICDFKHCKSLKWITKRKKLSIDR